MQHATPNKHVLELNINNNLFYLTVMRYDSIQRTLS